MSDLAHCHEDVSRRGESQPCDKVAVAMRHDPETHDPYPVCAYHCRADMVPLTDVLANAYNDDDKDAANLYLWHCGVCGMHHVTPLSARDCASVPPPYAPDLDLIRKEGHAAD